LELFPPTGYIFSKSRLIEKALSSPHFATSRWGGTGYKINQIFRFLLEKIDALGQRQILNPGPKIGFKRKGDD
jgi:hypothetical protein